MAIIKERFYPKGKVLEFEVFNEFCKGKPCFIPFREGTLKYTCMFYWDKTCPELKGDSTVCKNDGLCGSQRCIPEECNKEELTKEYTDKQLSEMLTKAFLNGYKFYEEELKIKITELSLLTQLDMFKGIK
jgi:hypothetical protein